jgi:hypothetical protein
MRLTALGEEAYATAFPIWRRTQERLLEALGAERWQELLSDLLSLPRSASQLAERQPGMDGVDFAPIRPSARTEEH